jgi:hypothetical protein
MKIHLIYHSHIDNGYTERQERIASYQADFIRQAVDCALSDKQLQRGEREKFKFTAEGFWAVEQYLEKYGESGKKRLLEAIRTGCFELTACYFHLTELLDSENLGRSLDYARAFAAENGIAMPDIAMAADINGFSWGFADILLERGICCLSANVNVHHGGPPLADPFKAFFWRAPGGEKILVYSGMPYHKANIFGLIPGYPQLADVGIPGEPRVIRDCMIENPDDLAKERVFQFVNYLRRVDYPYGVVPIMGSGLYTDNSPVGDGHCEMIEKWNRQYGHEIEIVTSTQREFFDALALESDKIAEYAGDWSDWWSDGVLSMPVPLRLFRNAQRGQKLVRKLDPSGCIVSTRDMEPISRNLILYAEHTFGHSASVLAPEELLVQQLEYRKIGYANSADAAAGKLMDRVTRALGEAEFTDHMPFTYQAINPHDHAVDTAVCLPFDYWEQCLFDQGNYALVDAQGREYATQLANGLRGKSVCCSVSLEARERKILTLLPGRRPMKRASPAQTNDLFENQYFRVSWDARGIRSLWLKDSGHELLNNETDRLCAPVYQVFEENARKAGCGANYMPRSHPENRIVRGEALSAQIVQSGPVFAVLRVEYRVEGCDNYCVDFTFYRDSSRIGISVKFVKQLVRQAEGLYAAFPLRLPDAKWHLSKAGTLHPADCQLPGVCHDHFTVGKGAALLGHDIGVALNTLDTPLIMLGGLKLWQYSSQADAAGALYSWLCNNKWDTYFKNECAGCHESRYVLQITSGASDCEMVMETNELPPIVIRSEIEG